MNLGVSAYTKSSRARKSDSSNTPIEKGEDLEYLSKQILTYIGNKRRLLPLIEIGVTEVKRNLKKDKLTTVDLFSGSGIVARMLKQHSRHIYANDMELYSTIINQCYLSNYDPALESELIELLRELKYGIEKNWVDNGFIAELYAPRDDANIQKGERVFYSRANAEFLDTARQQIAKLPEDLQKYFLAPLFAQASVHVNTAGVFKGFYKDDGVGCFGGAGKNALKRILGEIDVEVPLFSRFTCGFTVMQNDAHEALRKIPDVDLAYLDPPYNQHPYGSNYFMLNLLATYKQPTETSTISGIPLGWNRSAYNKPKVAREELFRVVNNCKASYLLISYNSEGFISYENFVEFLSALGELKVFETKYNAFRGSRNLRQRDIHTKEYLFLLKRS